MPVIGLHSIHEPIKDLIEVKGWGIIRLGYILGRVGGEKELSTRFKFS